MPATTALRLRIRVRGSEVPRFVVTSLEAGGGPPGDLGAGSVPLGMEELMACFASLGAPGTAEARWVARLENEPGPLDVTRLLVVSPTPRGCHEPGSRTV